MTLADNVLEQAKRYFEEREIPFWDWSEAGHREIIGAWKNSELIVFRDELAQILTQLQPQGWPPLSSLLLLIAATRTSWPQQRQQIPQCLRRSTGWPVPELDVLLCRLDTVAQLPGRLKESTEAKVQLARVVFEGSPPAFPAADTAHGLHYLRSILAIQHFIPRPSRILSPPSRIHLRDLAVGLGRVSAQVLESRSQTGLDQELVPAKITLTPEPTSFGGRLTQWSADPELYGIARIARQLVSVLSWPRPMSQPDEIPLGGVSDLTTSGELDRLLLSELVHDDDTLAMRIALKEALYVRREVPVQRTARQRLILVDTTLRMWGRPRIYGAAVALALAAAQDAEPELTVSVDVCDGTDWKAVNLTSRTGTLELLSSLSPQLHPGQAVRGWARHRLTDDLPCDPILITTAEALSSAEMQPALEQLPTEFYAAVVDGLGRLELRRHSAQGWRVLRTVQLDLDELLKPPASPRVLRLTTKVPDRVPAIFRSKPFPLRLPHTLEAGRLWMPVPFGVLALAAGGRVMNWNDAKKGPRQLGSELPHGRVEASATVWSRIPAAHQDGFDTLPGCTTQAVIRGKAWSLLTVDLETEDCRSLVFQTSLSPTDQSTKALIVPECAFLLGHSKIQAFSLDTGELLAEMPLVGSLLQFVGHRYLKSHQNRWTRLSFDGQIRLKPAVDHAQSAMLVEPPIGVCTDEAICLPCFRGKKMGSRTIPNYQDTSLHGVNQRGLLVMLSGTFSSLNGTGHHPSAVVAAWDLAAPDWRWNVFYTTSFDDAERQAASARIQQRSNLRHKFSTIDLGPTQVCLQSSKRALWRLQFDAQAKRLRMIHLPQTAESMNRFPFERMPWAGISLPLRSAALPEGNRVWLDGRGLMHLMPHSLDRPEITLVMDENHVSGWLSDGRVFGDDYYLDDAAPRVDVADVYQRHLVPFFGLVP